MAGPYTDRALTCVECGAEFTFTAGEQEKHDELGFQNEPKRCSPCRMARKQRSGGGGPRGAGSRGPREMHEAVCAECGQVATVPFKPRGDKPVYCSACFQNKR
jgi:CxxC-x17-CxxC domain-containing protein